MIPHLDIDAECSTTRISCLIDIEKNNKLVMPAILFYLNKEDMNRDKEYTSIDNPSYIYDYFISFLERFLLDKLTNRDKRELWNVLDIITEYKQARELLEMLKWLKDYPLEDIN